MKRTLLQIYVNGADEAIKLYERAFGAKPLEIVRSPEGKVFHSELDVYGQILAVADRALDEDGEQDTTGNIMQFCLHFGEGNEALVQKAYDALLEGATVRFPLGDSGWSKAMTDIVDRFGVRWCIFV